MASFVTWTPSRKIWERNLNKGSCRLGGLVYLCGITLIILSEARRLFHCVQSFPGQGILECLRVEYVGRESRASISSGLPALD